MTFHSFTKSLLVFVALTIVALLIYHPILNNSFLSDDYDSLYRICVEKKILFREFLRPLIDVSFYLNYRISGLDSWSYYAFNLGVHVMNAFLLYRLALSYTLFDANRQQVFALISAFLFLVYPFHNEGVVWLTGRLSSMACFFALVILNVWLSTIQFNLKLLLCLFLYFFGLLAYESILFLPFVIVILNLTGHTSRKYFLRSFLWAIAVIGLLLVIRFLISGAVYGVYGERMVTPGLSHYLAKSLKTLGRSFLPPSENSQMMEIGFIMFIILFAWIHFKLIKRYRLQKELIIKYLIIAGCFFTTMIIPMLFGISTRTSEGDRLLYFPSVFLCLMFSFLIIAVTNKNIFRWIYCLILSSYFVYFLTLNNKQWEKASEATSDILQATMTSGGRSVYLVNIPDELEGAYVFRNGFEKSLVLSQADTSKVFPVGYLTRLDYLKINGIIPVKKDGENITILPATEIINKGGGLVEVRNLKQNQRFLVNKDKSAVYYWNKSNLTRLF